MSYQITRECWNSKTYNGYEDSPYWKIHFDSYNIGLTDNGEYWNIQNTNFSNDNNYIRKELRRIIKECKLKIRLKRG